MSYYRGDYYRGDYYRGDYYRGDPWLGAAIGAIGRVAGKVLPMAARGIAKIAGGALGVAKRAPISTAATVVGAGATIAPMIAPSVTPASMPPSMMPDIPGYGRIPGTGIQLGTPEKWLPGGMQGAFNVPGNVIPRGYHINKEAFKKKPRPFKNLLVKNRRMNVTNPRALRRAVRRGQGFLKMARRIISFYSPKAPKGRMYFGKRKRR